MFETVAETFDDIRDSIGDKGFYIFIALAAAFGLYNLAKGSQANSAELTPVTSVSSYPDAVTNANVIIDTLQKSIDYSEGEIKEEIQGLGSGLDELINLNFEATNDYINRGFESQEKLLNENFDTINGGLEDMQTDFKGLNSVINEMKTTLNKKQTTTKVVSTPAAPAQSSSGVKLNVNTSIVDNLKSKGIDSSFENRAKIAAANGITNYTGSYAQNVALLNKSKAGTLKT